MWLNSFLMNSNKNFCKNGQAESSTQYTAFIPVHLTKSLWLFEDY